MSTSQLYRLPDGNTTSSADAMCDAWNELSAPFVSLGYVRYAFNPDIAVFKPWTVGYGGRILSMTVDQARELGAVIRERDELRSASEQTRAYARATQPAAAKSAVAIVTISMFRGHLENRDFDYFGNLPDGTHLLYAAPLAATQPAGAAESPEPRWQNAQDSMDAKFRSAPAVDAATQPQADSVDSAAPAGSANYSGMTEPPLGTVESAGDIVQTIALAMSRGYTPSEILDANSPIVARIWAEARTVR